MIQSGYKILKSSSAYYFVEILQKGILLLVTPLFANKLTFNEFGIVSAYIIIIAVSTPIISLSMHGAVTRLYHNYTRETGDFKFTVFSTLTILLVTISIPLYFILSSINSYSNENSQLESLILTGIILTQPYFTVAFAFLKVQHKIKSYVLIFSFYYSLQTILILALMVFLDYKVIGYLSAIFVSNVVVLVVLGCTLKSKKVHYFKSAIAKRTIKFSLSIFPVDALGMVNTYIDRYFIIAFIGVGFVGIYFITVQLSAAIVVAVIAINSVIAPLFYKQLANSNDINMKLTVSNDFEITIKSVLKIIFTLVVVLTIIGKVYINFLYDDSYSISAEVLPLVMLLSGTNVFFVLISNSINLEVSLIKIKMITVFIGILAGCIINYIFINKIGIWSVPIASLITIWIVTLTLKYFVDRDKLPALIKNSYILIYMIFTTIYMVYFFALKDFEYKFILDGCLFLISSCYLFRTVKVLREMELKQA